MELKLMEKVALRKSLNRKRSKRSECSGAISDVAQEFGLTPRALRFYEQKGLIDPLREGWHRIYRSEDKEKISIIARCKRIGLSLADIKRLLDIYELHGNSEFFLNEALGAFQRQSSVLFERLRDLDSTIEDLRSEVRSAQTRLAEVDEA